MDLEEATTIDLSDADLDAEVEWILTNLMGGPDMNSQENIRFHKNRLLEAFAVVNEFVTSLWADLLRLTTRGVMLKRL